MGQVISTLFKSKEKIRPIGRLRQNIAHNGVS